MQGEIITVLHRQEWKLRLVGCFVMAAIKAENLDQAAGKINV